MQNSKGNQTNPTSPTAWLSRLFIASMFGSALIFGAATTWADGDGHGYKHDPQSKLEHMTKKLDLTQEQQDNILPILQDKHQKMEALHNQMKEVRANAMAQVEAQLNPEQKEKFQKAREEYKEKMKEYKEKNKKGKGHGKDKHGKGKGHE
ncbi:MAG: periplasmic heavy metal sensor [Nitrospirales bacterium]